MSVYTQDDIYPFSVTIHEVHFLYRATPRMHSPGMHSRDALCFDAFRYAVLKRESGVTAIPPYRASLVKVQMIRLLR
jgi:hypothetical protein